MAKKEIARKDLWSVNDEKYFFERYSLLSDVEKPSYLIGQATSLFLQNMKLEPSILDAILRLTEKYFSDFPNDETFKVAGLLLTGRVYYALNEINKTFEYYKKAVDHEIKTEDFFSLAWLFYSEFVVKHEKIEFYDEIEKLVSMECDKLDNTADIYIATSILSVLAERKNDKEKQNYYKDLATEALKKYTEWDRSLRYVKIIKINDMTDAKEKSRLFISKNGFELRGDTVEPVWQKKGIFAMRNFCIIFLFDVVVIIAFINFRDVLTGQANEMGLNGFVAGFDKWPFKRQIKKFEKSLMQI